MKAQPMETFLDILAYPESFQEHGGFLIWFVFFVALSVFVFYSLILFYHWFSYGKGEKLMWKAFMLYLIGGGVLVAVLFLAIIAL